MDSPDIERPCYDFFCQIKSTILTMGYFQTFNRHYFKTINDGVRSVLRVNYTRSGSNITIYYGVEIDFIEQELIDMKFSDKSEICDQAGHQSIFQRLDLASKVIGGPNVPGRFDIGSPSFLEQSDLNCFLNKLEYTFSSIECLAKYCEKDKNLALGHHAVRIPFVFEAAGLNVSCFEYMQKVASLGLVPDYNDFVKKFTERFRKRASYI